MNNILKTKKRIVVNDKIAVLCMLSFISQLLYDLHAKKLFDSNQTLRRINHLNENVLQTLESSHCTPYSLS